MGRRRDEAICQRVDTAPVLSDLAAAALAALDRLGLEGRWRLRWTQQEIARAAGVDGDIVLALAELKRCGLAFHAADGGWRITEAGALFMTEALGDRGE